MTGSVADDDDMPEQTPAAAPAAAPTGKQRALLALVIILGVLILLGFAVLVGGLVMGAGGGGGASVNGKPWQQDLDVPADSHVVSAQAEGNRLIVRVASGAGEEIVLIDAGSGQIIGRVNVKPPR